MKFGFRSAASAAVTALAMAVAAPEAGAQAFNGGLIGSCVGNCGTIGANGVVGLSGLAGSTAHGYVSSNTNTNANANGIGYNLGGETSGSRWNYTFTTTNANTLLSFKFNYVTSDGTSSFIEYGYADLNVGPTVLANLFNARTTPSGNTVPGFGLPSIDATLSPNSTPIIAGQTTWSPLGGDSGACYQGLANGCGSTGWITMSYNIAAAGTYNLEIGVVNWGDNAFDSGLAFDFALGQGDVPTVPVPEPASAALLVAAFGGLVAARRRRNNA